ncbi:helix-turn-helix domain-containing protein [Megamonas funiformis]|uniref:helix-turn-helix domain-containing protein n=1 Tax=Megamonas funiformis TaxID=437897 RepID=UPI0011C22F91|nr:helix-turn-helix transcriptional regulator [Megamonas funiformis]
MKVVDFMTLGQRIKEERIKQGISMNKLAKSVGIAQSGLSDLEAGKRQVSFETAIKLIEALGFKPNEFFSNKQPAQSPEIIQLIKSVEKLTPEQIEQLTKFIDSMTEK